MVKGIGLSCNMVTSNLALISDYAECNSENVFSIQLLASQASFNFLI